MEPQRLSGTRASGGRSCVYEARWSTVGDRVVWDATVRCDGVLTAQPGGLLEPPLGDVAARVRAAVVAAIDALPPGAPA